MIKVTVLYNLFPGDDEEEFLRWRTTTHHAKNIARPGVLRSDFYKVTGMPGIGTDRPAVAKAPYRFITESYYESYETFRADWDDPAEQARLVPAVAKIADAVFLISEEVQTFQSPRLSAHVKEATHE